MDLPQSFRTLLIAFASFAVPGSLVNGEINTPFSPAESLGHFQLEPGLLIEIAAAEPEVVDPVDIRFDEQGRLWVAEMRDYPTGPGSGKPALSHIRWLEDRDGDGRYETAHDFAQQVPFVNGV